MMKYDKHPAFIVHDDDPFNGGAPAYLLRGTPITSRDLFYVRAHAPVPTVDAKTYCLRVGGMVKTPLTLSLDDLKRDFAHKTLTATLQCAGNRRNEFNAVAPMPGESVMWGNEAISTAVWGGVSLADVLARADIDPEAEHVAFVSLDRVEKDGETFGYGGSIPLDKALRAEVLLAYEMNGETLPPVHGYPLRVVVPGYIAARSVKWLAEITVQRDPSDNYYQQRDYKHFPPNITADNVDWNAGEMLGELITDSVICLPRDGEQLSAGEVTVQGYALGGGDTEITRVEVSYVGGNTWTEAHLLGEPSRWAWRFWEARLSLPAGTHTLIVRAYDSDGRTQPQHLTDVWNFKGYMNNVWHSVTVTVGDAT